MRTNLGYLLSDNSRQLRRLFDDRVSRLGLTAVQARLLLSLDKFPDRNQAYYAERLEIEPITLTRIVDRMEDAGWIERRADPSDRRARILHLTAKSHDVVDPLRAILETMVEDMLEGISAEERETMMRLLETISANVARQRAGKELIDG